MSDAIAGALERLGVPSGARTRLARYGELVLAGNARVNLTAARTPEAIAEHIADALPLVPLVGGALVDIGSGAGLPGIPLAILCGVPVTLIEAIAKKAAFLREAAAELGLDGTVVVRRAEEAAHEPALRERFDHATARAVASAPSVLELTAAFVRIGGSLLLQRGAFEEDERNAVVDAAPILGAVLEAELPSGSGRTLLLVRKVAATPGRFPRRTGIPAKRPLCLR